MDFRIITVGTRPKREVLLARAVSEEGTNIVEVRTYIPRGPDPDEDWEFGEVVDFGTRLIAPLRSYIANFSDAAAKEFIQRAVAEAKKNTDTPEPPAPAH